MDQSQYYFVQIGNKVFCSAEVLPGQACIFWPFNVSLQMIARQIIAWTDNGDKFLEKKMVLVDVCVNVIVYAKSG